MAKKPKVKTKITLTQMVDEINRLRKRVKTLEADKAKSLKAAAAQAKTLEADKAKSLKEAEECRIKAGQDWINSGDDDPSRIGPDFQSQWEVVGPGGAIGRVRPAVNKVIVNPAQRSKP